MTSEECIRRDILDLLNDHPDGISMRQTALALRLDIDVCTSVLGSMLSEGCCEVITVDGTDFYCPAQEMMI